ncbi:MAG TPA: folylpolyglutamate synthase/dihydrofolate synthase family protein [Cytophagaceae bacterium]
MFHRIGPAAYKNNLDNILHLAAHLGNPHTKFKSIHVAGTNGKGSTSHMLAAILQKAGYKTGLYTSPHLKDFSERIRVNGVPISENAICQFVEKNRVLLEQLKPSFFEMATAMGFDYFAKEKVDVAVIEVGLGGRLDSTNIITPELSVITNISFDHQNLLGDTLPEIAGEKAGIIKKGVPVVISEYQEEIADVFKEKAQKENSPIYFANHFLKLKNHHLGESLSVEYETPSGDKVSVESDLAGEYQLKNIAGVLTAIELLRQKGFVVPENTVKEALSATRKLTGLKGRWQCIQQSPLVICDTGHNESGIREIVRQISRQRFKRLHIVIGMVKDKSISNVLLLLPKEAFYYFCEAKLPRALAAEELAVEAERVGLKGIIIKDVNDAFQTALANSEADDMIFVGGSTFVVAELNEL